MKYKDLFLFLILEALTALNAVVSFRYIHHRMGAIALAGAGFVALGLYMVWKTWGWKDKWVSLSFWGAHIHLWLSSLPLFVHRAIYWGDFSKDRIFGIHTAPFHIFSQYVFYALMIGTVLDIAILFVRKRVA